MTWATAWRGVVIVIILATMALLLYTVGAPHEHGG